MAQAVCEWREGVAARVDPRAVLELPASHDLRDLVGDMYERKDDDGPDHRQPDAAARRESRDMTVAGARSPG